MGEAVKTTLLQNFSLKRRLRTAAVKTLKLLSPDKTLKLLFHLDKWLYYLQGQMATVYGNGVHPKHRHIGYHDFFVARLASGERVLDVGCNNGAVSLDMAERAGVRVVGIEIRPSSLELARNLHPHPNIEYRLGNVLTDMTPEPFDVIVLSNVLEHFSDRPIFLQRLQELTKPTRLLIRVPSFERDWRVPLKKELGVDWRLDPTHQIEYTQENFAEDMEAAGLCITYQEVRWGEIWAETVPINLSIGTL